jgi:23S rRNA pseudouridine1911/1915/1917 synthase
MAYIHKPIVGDQSYGGRLILPPNATDAFKQVLRGFKRQALHAARLTIVHPKSKQIMCWHAPLPDDMATLIKSTNEDFLQAADG